MATPTYEQVITALQNADKAGDVEAARQLAQLAATLSPSAPSPLKQAAQAAFTKAQNAPVIGPVGMLEAGANLVSGGAASALGGLAGLVGTMLPGPEGQGADIVRRVQEAGTYQPRTEAGKAAVEAVSAPMELGSQALGAAGGYVGKQLGNEAAGQAIGEATLPVAATLMGARAPLKSIATTPYTGVGISPSAGLVNARAAGERAYGPLAEEQAAAASAADWQNSARIDTAKAIKDLPHPISVNPAYTNPTKTNRIVSSLTGQEAIDTAIVSANKNQWGKNAKADMGIHPEVPLTSVAPFKAVRAKAAAPYKEVSKLGELTPDETVLSAIKNIEIPDLISDPKASTVVQGVVNRALDKVSSGMTGAQVLEQIKQLRADADNTSSVRAKGGKVDPSDISKAEAQLTVANALEDLIELNLPIGSKLLADLKKARYEIKKSYDYQKATDLDTGLVDPSKLPENMSGIGETMRKAAANFPTNAKVTTAPIDKAINKVSRAGVAGSVGALMGSFTPVGPIGGGLIGASVGELLGKLNASRVASPAYQAKNMLPLDRRIMPTEAPAPVQAPMQQLGSEGYIPPTPFRESTPNWRFSKQEGMWPQPPQQQGFPQLPAPSAEGTMASLRAEQARAGEMSRTLGKQSEAALAAQEAAAKAEVKRGRGQEGIQYTIDAGGNLVPVSTSIPSKLLAPSSLETAVKKLSGIVVPETQTTYKTTTVSPKTGTKPYTRITKREGETTYERGVSQAFDLTAEERIAWNKAKADIVDAVPELKGLSEKAILSKINDRQWVQEAINTANQKAEMYAQMEQRSQDRTAQSLARISREKLMDAAEQLQEILGGRPSSRGYRQGPKTQAFQRGLLSGEQQ